MAVKKKQKQDELKKLMDVTKRRLKDLGKETSVWLKKGEVELTRLSKMGKLEISLINLNIRKDKVYRDIGKRIVEGRVPEEIKDATLKRLSTEARALLREIQKTKKTMARVSGQRKKKK